jgi:hypothetical protein
MAKAQKNNQATGQATGSRQTGANQAGVNQLDLLEQGEIFFLYRPAIAEEDVKGLQDVQRFFILLHPENSRNHRLIVIGKKRLPDAEHAGDRFWGFVDAVLRTDKDLKEQFSAESYETQTGGDRLLPSMRPAGSGNYQLMRHGNHTHLVYELALPEQPSDVQQELNIARAATYLLSVKNPTASAPQGVGLEDDQKAELPKALLEHFHGRRFIDADPPELLDYEGVEILLISTDESVQELGIDLDAQSETADRDAEYVFKSLRMQQSAEKEKSLVNGKWQ